MDKLQYQLFKITDVSDFDAYWDVYNDGQPVMPKLGDTLIDSYSSVLSVLLPGVAEDGTRAAVLKIVIPGVLQGEVLSSVSTTILNCSADTFGQDNLIAVNYLINDKQTIYHIFMLPIKKRVPNIAQWLNSHKKDTPNDFLISKYEDVLENVIPGFTPIIAKEKLTDEEKGYQPALINYHYHKELKSDITPLIYTTTDETSQVQTITPFDQINRYVNETIQYYTTGPERTAFREVQTGRLERSKFDASLKRHVEKFYPDLPESDWLFMKRKLDRWAYGMYILEPLIDDDDISDIQIKNYNLIRVKVKNRRFTSNIRFLNQEDYMTFIAGLGARNGLDLIHKDIHVFSDTRTSSKFRMRMNLVSDYLTSDEVPYYQIRKIAKQKRDFKYLLDNNMLDETLMNYLIDRARYGSGMVFTGKGASGKTTLMNALLDKIPFDKSGLVIQESEELFSDVHPHLMFERMRLDDPNRQYKLEHLARNGLLTDIDYFIIGEIKGDEAADFMMASYTGAKCWCSVHSASALEAMDKLGDYVMKATRYDINTVNKMLAYLGTVVFIKDFQVCEIAELKKWDAEKQKLIYEPIYLRPGMEHSAFQVA